MVGGTTVSTNVSATATATATAATEKEMIHEGVYKDNRGRYSVYVRQPLKHTKQTMLSTSFNNAFSYVTDITNSDSITTQASTNSLGSFTETFSGSYVGPISDHYSLISRNIDGSTILENASTVHKKRGRKSSGNSNKMKSGKMNYIVSSDDFTTMVTEEDDMNVIVENIDNTDNFITTTETDINIEMQTEIKLEDSEKDSSVVENKLSQYSTTEIVDSLNTENENENDNENENNSGSNKRAKIENREIVVEKEVVKEVAVEDMYVTVLIGRYTTEAEAVRAYYKVNMYTYNMYHCFCQCYDLKHYL
jgi:hypothetical protein